MKNKRIKPALLLLVVGLLLLCTACGAGKGAGIPLPSGYTVASGYEKYISPAERGSLQGSSIAFRGTVGQAVSYEGAYGYIVEAENGKWLVVMGTSDAGYELTGKQVIVYGTYEGFSEAEQLPAVFTDAEQDKILVEATNETYYFWG